MAEYFVDSANGNDVNSGVDTDNAWATIEHAMEAGALSAGDFVWARRNVQETPGSDIATSYDGTVASPISIIGCPRNSHSIASSDWTNGSTSVTIDDNDMDREKHQSRYVVAPDGETYLITRVSATNTIIIEREYAGSTVTNQAATIPADEDYATFAAIDDSTWTIKIATWTADADDVVTIDFNDGAFGIYSDLTAYNIWKNIEFKDSTDGDGIYRCRRSTQMLFFGCLFKQTTSNSLIVSVQNGSVDFVRCTFEGSGAGSNQTAIVQAYLYNGYIRLKDVAIYNMGNHGMEIADNCYMDNVNIGVETANADDDIAAHLLGNIRGVDVKLGGTNGLILFTNYPSDLFNHISFENYQRILEEHKSFYIGGEYARADVTGETPNKKVSDYVFKISPDRSFASANTTWAVPILVHELEMTAAAHTLKYWLYNDSGVTLNDTTAIDDIYLEAEYIKGYDDTSEYNKVNLRSSEIDILDAADADDWDYLQVTLTPAVASKVRLTVYIKFYSAAGDIFIDPAVVIT